METALRKGYNNSENFEFKKFKNDHPAAPSHIEPHPSILRQTLLCLAKQSLNYAFINTIPSVLKYIT